MTGGLDPVNDRILAVETGGHISTIFKGCEYKLGYIGHAINGSYASDYSGNSEDYRFDGAAIPNLCALELPPVPEVKIGRASCRERVKKDEGAGEWKG